VLPDGLSEARLALYDLSGKLIETQKLEAANSVAIINIQNLSNGTYLVALEGNDRILLRGKLVKD
ncbi:MAG: T9SS type A sorting domain-containing protein, partial [Chitinophagales bacterium]